jgi:transcription elongation factor SPT6
LLKNYSINVKKAVSLARFEQDPMNEVLNLWSPIQSENAALNLNLHPMQRHVHQGKLVDALEEMNIKVVNRIGIDINLLVEHEHWHNQLQFLSGLGPRKAMIYIQKMKAMRKSIPSRAALYVEGILGKLCFLSSSGFTKVRNTSDKKADSNQYNSLDQTRIHPRNYESVYQLVTDVLGDGSEGPEKGKKIVNELIADPEKLNELAKGEEIRQEIKKIDQAGLSELVGQMIEDLMRPFMDFREQHDIVRGPDDYRFRPIELFYCLINETERTFKAGLII